MNMHGIIEPAAIEVHERPNFWARARYFVRRNRVLLLIVVLPTLLLAGYLYMFAADQYESEAHFLVRSSDPSPQPSVGVSQLISSATGIGSNSQDEVMSVADYLTSHDVVAKLAREDDLINRFRRPEADVLSRLRFAHPTPETLLRYYRRQVSVEYSTETGITTLTVHAFRPSDAYALARKLLQLGEQRVNELNIRSYTDAVAMARRQLNEAEDALAQNQERMTHFRSARADIDPTATSAAQLTLVTTLTGQLTSARAQLNAMRGLIKPSSPQFVAQQARVEALEAQVNRQSGRLIGASGAIANDISGYESLKLRQQFLAKRYEAVALSLQQARERALRQQLYVVRVVDANMPVKSLFPQRARILGTVFVALLLAYSIGWLIAAGVREHAA